MDHTNPLKTFNISKPKQGTTRLGPCYMCDSTVMKAYINGKGTLEPFYKQIISLRSRSG